MYRNSKFTFEEKLKVDNVGSVIEISDGISRIYGLSDVMSSELVEFDDGKGTLGITLNLEDIKSVLTEIRSKTKFDPEELQSLNERLFFINNLKKKYGSNIKEIISDIETPAFGYEKKECRKCHDLLIDMIKRWNKHIFDNACKVARIKPLEENHIKVEEYVDKRITKTYVLDGTLEKIFDDFTSMNRHVTYVNGHFFRFEDERIETVYDLFVRLYDGNFFLDNAVKAGCIID